MFFHMLLLADDFGCISVSPTFLRRRCFSDSPTVERIAKLLTELIDVDLIRTYEVERTCLAFIPRFGQRLQRDTLKHLAPPETLYQDDAEAAQKFLRIKNKTQKPTVLQPLETVGQPPEEKRREVIHTSMLDGFTEFYQAYPRKVARGAAEKMWAKIRPNADLLAEMLAALAKWKLPSEVKFIPHPATWLNEKRWLDEVREAQKGMVI